MRLDALLLADAGEEQRSVGQRIDGRAAEESCCDDRVAGFDRGDVLGK
ncbi:MAG: hypothetical protein V9G24_18865 [Rhodoblastus sp.]